GGGRPEEPPGGFAQGAKRRSPQGAKRPEGRNKEGPQGPTTAAHGRIAPKVRCPPTNPRPHRRPPPPAPGEREGAALESAPRNPAPRAGCRTTAPRGDLDHHGATVAPRRCGT